MGLDESSDLMMNSQIEPITKQEHLKNLFSIEKRLSERGLFTQSEMKLIRLWKSPNLTTGFVDYSEKFPRLAISKGIPYELFEINDRCLDAGRPYSKLFIGELGKRIESELAKLLPSFHKESGHSYDLINVDGVRIEVKSSCAVTGTNHKVNKTYLDRGLYYSQSSQFSLYFQHFKIKEDSEWDFLILVGVWLDVVGLWLISVDEYWNDPFLVESRKRQTQSRGSTTDESQFIKSSELHNLDRYWISPICDLKDVMSQKYGVRFENSLECLFDGFYPTEWPGFSMVYPVYGKRKKNCSGGTRFIMNHLGDLCENFREELLV